MKLLRLEDIIVYEDEDYIVINKPPFVPSLDERFIKSVNILQLAKAYNSEARVCHRLDRETSGIMALAKNDEAYRNLSIQFERRKVDKTYHAVANGIHSFENKCIDVPLTKKDTAITHIDWEDGKDALTCFTTIKAYHRHTLIACKPVTGRMHQIRIHLAYCKAPLVGDELYNGKNIYLSEIKKKYNASTKDEEEQPIIKRFALHARQLEFDTLSAGRKKFEAEYPKDFAVLIKLLEKYS